MKKVLGFAGSNSYDSINKQLVGFALSYFVEFEVELLDVNDYEVAIYSKGREEESGIPSLVEDFASKISGADLLVISLAENNASYNAGFKNLYDWISRISDRKVFDDKPMLLMATSPGGRGGQSVLAAALDRFPRDGARVLESFSLPGFHSNFDTEKGLVSDKDLKSELEGKIESVKRELKA